MMQPLIAIVSGDEGLAASLNVILSLAGYHVLWCGVYFGAHEIIRAQQPDLVLLDVRPDRLDSGLLVLNRLQQDLSTRPHTIALLSPHNTFDAEAMAAFSSARCPLLTIPCSPENFLATIIRLLPPLERAVGS